MSGISRTLYAVTATRALIASAAILASAVAHAESGRPGGGDETAIAVPRVVLPDGNPGVALPQPLDPSDATRIRQIFALQQSGNVLAAARATVGLGDPLLIGDIMADRYLGRFHHATAEELTTWLRRYPDLPDAPAIHALLQHRLPKGASAPPSPRLDPLPSAGVMDPAGLEIDGSELDRADRHVRALFTDNRDREAVRTGRGYISGLAAWRLGLIGLARTRFEKAAGDADSPASIRAAAAFWAARANLRVGNHREYATWMRRAATSHATFYGLIAGHLLGSDAGLASGRGVASNADVEAIAATPQGWRAFALLQVDQPERAETELRLLWPVVRDNAPLRRSLSLVAAGTGMVDLAAQLAAPFVTQSHGEARAAVPSLHPIGGFSVDPALIYALTRLESNFHSTVVSRAGARGLMQLMPVTARYVSGNASLPSARLDEPSVNLELGQRYVRYLAQQDAIDDDLIRMLVSYNAGIGNLLRWNDRIRDHGDPLLFIEAIPNDETRGFVQRALAYTWVYAARFGFAAPSLDELAADQFPRFTPRAAEGRLVAVAPRLH